MDFQRLMRIIKKLNDIKYIEYKLFELSDKIILKKYLSILKEYHKGRNYDFTFYRNQRLQKICNYAYKNCKYYNILFNKYNINTNDIVTNFDKIPFLTRDIIRKEKDNILSSRVTKNFYGYFTTGGSTGEPLGFYTCGSADPEHQRFLFEIIGYQSGDRILAMDGTLIPEKLLENNIFWITKNTTDLPYGRVALSSLYLNRNNIQYYIKFIDNFKPAIIRGYPSFINEIANYILKNDIHFNFTIKGIELTSESVYDYQLENIKKAFKTRIFIQYGHAEASVFGYSIDDSLICYCSPLYGYTEIIGDNGKHVKPGEIGEVVVTGFYNMAMPFIRYRTGDLALYDGEENGIVRLKRIFGRTQDFIYTKNMEKILLTAIIFGRHYKAFNNIKKWQIIQNEPGKVIFKIIKDEGYSDLDENEIRQNFYSIAGIETSFEYVDEIPLTQRGKSKFLISNINL